MVQGGFSVRRGLDALRGEAIALATVAGLGGMGGLAEAALAEEEDGQDARESKVLQGMARLLAETGPQLALQNSLLMAKGESLLEQPALFVSVALSLGSGVKKAQELTMAAMRDASSFGFVVGLSVSACVWAFLAYVVAKLYFLEVCPSRECGLTTGCVDV